MNRATIVERASALTDKAKVLLEEGSGVIAKARSLVLGDAQFFATAPNVTQIRDRLADSSTVEKKEGMKRIIANMCKGIDMSELFPDVVKNIHAPSIELRKLIYFYVIHYAQERPNEALLSISVFQKDLVHASRNVRSLALRMLTSIRIPVLLPVMMVAIRKASSDVMDNVRITTALSLAQVNDIRVGNETQEEMVQLLHQLLGDRSREVVGAATAAYYEICPNQFELIHKHYRRMCAEMVRMTPWRQVVVLHVLLRYVRTQFVNPNETQEKTSESGEANAKEDYSDVTTPSESEVVAPEKKGQDLSTTQIDPDHRLFLSKAKQLLHSLNRAVVLGAVAALFHAGPRQELQICVQPLVRLLSGPADSHLTVLSTIYTLALKNPTMFASSLDEFFFVPEDSTATRELRIRIISMLVTEETVSSVLFEMNACMRSSRPEIVVAAVRALGFVALKVKKASAAILNLISQHLSHKSECVVTECVTVLRQLAVVGADSRRQVKMVHGLVIQLLRGEIRIPAARAAVVWLVGESIALHVAIARVAPDCFRVLAKSFVQEHADVKRQVLQLGTKLWFFMSSEGEVAMRFKRLFFYVLELVKYERDYELRDRGRIVECILDRNSETFKLCKESFLERKPMQLQRDPFADREAFHLGSLAHVCGFPMPGYQGLPPWASEPTDSAVRNVPGIFDAPASSADSVYSDSDKACNDDGQLNEFCGDEESDDDADKDFWGSDDDIGVGAGGDGVGDEEDEDLEDDSDDDETPAVPATRRSKIVISSVSVKR